MTADQLDGGPRKRPWQIKNCFISITPEGGDAVLPMEAVPCHAIDASHVLQKRQQTVLQEALNSTLPPSHFGFSSRQQNTLVLPLGFTDPLIVKVSKVVSKSIKPRPKFSCHATRYQVNGSRIMITPSNAWLASCNNGALDTYKCSGWISVTTRAQCSPSFVHGKVHSHIAVSRPSLLRTFLNILVVSSAIRLSGGRLQRGTVVGYVSRLGTSVNNLLVHSKAGMLIHDVTRYRDLDTLPPSTPTCHGQLADS